jgi:polysaccharide biosynthesis/export protein
MTKRLLNAKVVANHQGGRRRVSLAGRWVATLLMLVATVGLEAQFNGPALDLSTTVNRKVTLTTDPAILFPSAREIQLGQGDLIAIHLYGMVDYAPIVRVALDGTIQLPLIGVVAVDGLSLHDAEKLIATRLADAGMYRNPQVTIQLMESPNEVVTVTGELHGIIPVAGGKRLYDVLSAAGGLPPTASHIITINRPGIEQPITIDLGTDPAKSAQSNIPIFPRDTIILSRVGVVYLLGAFKVQGAIPLQQNTPLTLMQLTALGGGPGFEGNFSDLRIIRTTGMDRTLVKVNIKRVIDGKDPDPVLQADDIVFLPTSAMKAAIKGGGVGTALGIASVLLYTIYR